MRRNIDLQSVHPAGLEPAEPTEQRRKSPLGAQGTALCSGRSVSCVTVHYAWDARNIGFSLCTRAGLEPAELDRRQPAGKSPLGAQGTALCSGRSVSCFFRVFRDITFGCGFAALGYACLGVSYRQHHPKSCAGSGFALDLDLPPMCFDNHLGLKHPNA